MSESQTAATPRHLWIVGVLALLWNLMGGFDYLMTQTENASYMAKFTPEQLEFFYGFPVWVEFFWAIAVWGGIAGVVLMLMRRKLAVPVLIVSFLSMVVTMIHNYGMASGAEVMGAQGALFSAIIFVIALALPLYSRAMTARGVLT